MKNAIGIITLSILLIGCSMNPSKEARIQKLETGIQQSIEDINQLKKRIKILEETNAALQSKIDEIENR